VNKPPRADISPKEQTITLPTNEVVLDGSSEYIHLHCGTFWKKMPNRIMSNLDSRSWKEVTYKSLDHIGSNLSNFFFVVVLIISGKAGEKGYGN